VQGADSPICMQNDRTHSHGRHHRHLREAPARPADAAAAHLLVEGRIAPGAKLNERELCEVLHVSRTPLREAIKMLAAEGLVDLLPNRGAVAPWKLTEADVRNTFEVLAGLEGLSGELAAQRITDAELDEIRALHLRDDGRLPRAARPVGLLPAQRAHPRRHQRRRAQPGAGATYRQVNARVQALRFRTNQDEAPNGSAPWENTSADGRRAGRARRRRHARRAGAAPAAQARRGARADAQRRSPATSQGLHDANP
jgi:DNA-binding GntR family transcriptional regulator